MAVLCFVILTFYLGYIITGFTIGTQSDHRTDLLYFFSPFKDTYLPYLPTHTHVGGRGRI